MNQKNVILIVDDIPTNLEVLLDFLSDYGFEVLVAVDGESAIEQIDYAKPDIVLLDVMMPGINGFETCRRLKESTETADIPVIFMTALSETVDKVRGFQLGAVDYITKPLQQEEVLARVNTHLRIQKLQRDLQQANETLEQRVAERTNELAVVIEELRQTNQAYSRFMPKEFLRLLNLQKITDVQLGDQVQMEMTILFSDIRNFTHLSESMSPQDNFSFINAYLRRVSPIIRQCGGFIDKYIGDAIMALFPGKADDAICAAIDMQHEVSTYNQQRRENGYQPIRIGVGIHTGKLMLGTIGESERMEGTVISDAVNLAARMEGLTKHYGANIVMSEQTLLRLENSDVYRFRFIDLVQVKGKQEPVSVFELFDGDSPNLAEAKAKSKSVFEQGLLIYHDRDFETARSYFEQVLADNPDDTAATIYLERIDSFLANGGPPADWRGIEMLTGK